MFQLQVQMTCTNPLPAENWQGEGNEEGFSKRVFFVFLKFLNTLWRRVQKYQKYSFVKKNPASLLSFICHKFIKGWKGRF